MADSNSVHERYEGIDRSVLDEDVWADGPAKVTCPTCGLGVDAGTIRCPRCNALVLTGCSGSCSSCGSRTCLRGEE